MKPSSGTLALVRIFVWVIAITVALGYFAHVRAQSGGLPEQGMVIPLRPLAPLSTVPVPPVFGMEGILADKTAAIELGKALFWDMQAGSDDIQACASCHFNAGADSRAINQVSGSQGVFGLTGDKITVDVQVTGGTGFDNDPNQIDSPKTSEGGDNEGFTYGDGKPHLPR